MHKERPEVERATQAVCGREGMQCIRIPNEHAGGKLRLQYESSIREGGKLEVDLNYLLRLALWPLARYDSRIRGMFEAKDIPLLDYGEVDGELLTSDQEMIECIHSHPALHWKALNVRKYKNREE